MFENIPFDEKYFPLVGFLIILIFTLFVILPVFDRVSEEVYVIDYAAIQLTKKVTFENNYSEELILVKSNNSNQFYIYTLVPQTLADEFIDIKSSSQITEIVPKRVFETKQINQETLFVKLSFSENIKKHSTINLVFAKDFIEELSEEQWDEFVAKLTELSEIELSILNANEFENSIAMKIIDSYELSFSKHNLPNKEAIYFFRFGVSPSFFSAIISAMDAPDLVYESVTDEQIIIPPTGPPSNVNPNWLPLTREEKRAHPDYKLPRDISVNVSDYFNPQTSTSFFVVNPADLSRTSLQGNEYNVRLPFYEGSKKGSGEWFNGIRSKNHDVTITPTYEFNPTVLRVTDSESDLLDILTSLGIEDRVQGNFESYLSPGQHSTLNLMLENGRMVRNEPYKVDIDFDFTPILRDHQKIPEKIEGYMEISYGPFFGGYRRIPVVVDVETLDSDVLMVTLGGALEKDPEFDGAIESYIGAVGDDGLGASYYELDNDLLQKLFVDTDFSKFTGENANVESTETYVLNKGERLDLGNGDYLIVGDEFDYGASVNSNTTDYTGTIDEATGTVTFEIHNLRQAPYEFRQTQVAKLKDVIDVLRIHVEPEYLLILGGDGVIPLAEVEVFDVSSDWLAEVVYTDEFYGAMEFDVSDTKPLKLSGKIISKEDFNNKFSDIPIGRMPSPRNEKSTALITKQLLTSAKLHEEGNVIRNVGIYYDDDSAHGADLDGSAKEIRKAIPGDSGYYNASDFYTYYFPEEYPDLQIENDGENYYDLVAQHDIVFYYLHGNGDRMGGEGPQKKLETVIVGVDGEEEEKKLDSYYVLTEFENFSKKSIELNGQGIFSCSCFGASPFESETPLYEEFFRQGAGYYIGNTSYGYGQETRDNTYNATSRKILLEILEGTKSGNDLGNSVLNSKQKLLEKGVDDNDLVPVDVHQLYNTILYGDPTLRLEFDIGGKTGVNAAVPVSDAE